MPVTQADVRAYVNQIQTIDEIDAMFALLKARVNTLRVEAVAFNVATLSKGDRVRVRDIKPKYLNGVTGTLDHFETRPGGKKIAAIKPSADDEFTVSHLLIDGLLKGIPVSCVEAY